MLKNENLVLLLNIWYTSTQKAFNLGATGMDLGFRVGAFANPNFAKFSKIASWNWTGVCQGPLDWMIIHTDFASKILFNVFFEEQKLCIEFITLHFQSDKIPHL